MAKFLNLDPEFFGIDINDLALRVVKLKKCGKGFSVASFGETPIPAGVMKEGIIKDPALLAKTITTAIASVKGEKIRTREVVISLPEEKSFSQIIEMPAMGAEELAGAVPFEAENYIPLPMNSVYLDFEMIGNQKAGRIDVLMNAMPRNIVDSYVSCFKAAGVEPWVLEVESAAIARALIKQGSPSFAKASAGEQSSVGILDLGVSSTTFIVYANNAIRFSASIPVGGQQLTRLMAEQLGIDTQKAEALKKEFGLTKPGEQKHAMEEILAPVLSGLVAQVKKYLDFYYSHSSNGLTQREKISQLLLCGGGANLKKLPEFLAKELKIPVALGDPFVNIVRQTSGGKNNIPYAKVLSFTTALGLALLNRTKP